MLQKYEKSGKPPNDSPLFLCAPNTKSLFKFSNKVICQVSFEFVSGLMYSFSCVLWVIFRPFLLLFFVR